MIQTKMIKNVLALVAVAFLVFSLNGCGGSAALANKTDSAVTKTVGAGETWVVSETTELGSLVVGDGALIKAPEGSSLSLTVDGVETGQILVTTEGVDTKIAPGTYQGDVILTVTESNPVEFQGLTFPLRQALYLDDTGIVSGKSVMAAVSGEPKTASDLDDITIQSSGECFNGIYVAGGEYTLKNIDITLTGNGRTDMIGYGSAIYTTGENTRLVLDGANIHNKGVVRTAAIAAGGSSLIVKNSTLTALDGILPEDYVPSADLAQMRGGFPVGGSLGNARATNLLGENTRATYINSEISAEGWGVLSSDNCTTPSLTVINCQVDIDGNIGGYGTYAIGDAKETFLGCDFNVAYDVSTLKGGYLVYDDSTPQAVSKLNTELELGLTQGELDAIPSKSSVINSDRFGIMCTGSGTVEIGGGTVFNTGETLFLNKGGSVDFKVDGADGAELNARNGIIFQMMDNDDPGPTGKPYTEPTEAPEKDEDWDLTATADASTATFSNIELVGDFYNAIGWGKAASSGGGMSGGAPGGMSGGAPEGMAPGGGMPGGSGGEMPGGQGGAPGEGMAAGGPPSGGMPSGTGGEMPGGSEMAAGGPSGGMPGGSGGGMAGGMGSGGGSGKNMALTFDNAVITGVITSSEAHHLKPELNMNADEYLLFGVVTNMAHPAINNGVIVSLENGSSWTVTGTSYLNKLTVDAGSSITAPSGYQLAMTVDGVTKKIGAGDYQGEIMLTVTKE